MAAGRWRGGEGKARGGGDGRRRRGEATATATFWLLLELGDFACAGGWRWGGGGWLETGWKGEQSFGRGHALLGAHLSVTVYGLASQAMLKIIERLLLEFYV